MMIEIVVHHASFQFHHDLNLFNHFNSHFVIIIQAVALATPSFFWNDSDCVLMIENVLYNTT